jgi:hypothetical protein
MAESSVLLLVQRHPAYRGVIPGKLFEYVGSRRPILAVCPFESEMASLLRAYADVRLVDPGRPAEIVPSMERLLDEHRAGTLQTSHIDADAVAPLRRVEQVKRLVAILERVAR